MNEKERLNKVEELKDKLFNKSYEVKPIESIFNFKKNYSDLRRGLL